MRNGNFFSAGRVTCRPAIWLRWNKHISLSTYNLREVTALESRNRTLVFSNTLPIQLSFFVFFPFSNMFAKSITVLWALLLLVSTAQAQFQFFEQMFGGGGHGGHGGEQEASSDSSWYQRTWEGGRFINPSHLPSPETSN